MNKIKPYEILPISETIIWEEMRDYLGETEFYEDEFHFFEGDPDILYIDGEVIGYVNIDEATRQIGYALLHDAKECYELLEKVAIWADDTSGFKKLTGGWELVERKGQTMAYRGGEGYTYGIWAM